MEWEALTLDEGEGWKLSMLWFLNEVGHQETRLLFTEAERPGQAGIAGESDLCLEHSHCESQLVSQVCGLEN